jgi:hypothetical protein
MWIIAITEIEYDRNFLPLVPTNLPLLLPSNQTQLPLHYPNLTRIFHHASQRRRILRQRPHRGRPRRCSRRLWRRTYTQMRMFISSLRLTKNQATLQHTKNNVAPMPEIEKGEGTIRPPHLPLFASQALQRKTATKEESMQGLTQHRHRRHECLWRRRRTKGGPHRPRQSSCRLEQAPACRPSH